MGSVRVVTAATRVLGPYPQTAERTELAWGGRFPSKVQLLVMDLQSGVGVLALWMGPRASDRRGRGGRCPPPPDRHGWNGVGQSGDDLHRAAEVRAYRNLLLDLVQQCIFGASAWADADIPDVETMDSRRIHNPWPAPTPICSEAKTWGPGLWR